MKQLTKHSIKQPTNQPINQPNNRPTYNLLIKSKDQSPLRSYQSPSWQKMESLLENLKVSVSCPHYPATPSYPEAHKFSPILATDTFLFDPLICS
jgi:hypothetical protein